jgi:hypothetical protein
MHVAQSGREVQCCICGGSGTWEEMLGMSLFPALRIDDFQQWFVHPRCIKGVMAGQTGPIRDELVEFWNAAS